MTVFETGAGDRSLDETLERLVADVPDFPEPGVGFKDITPLLADHAGFAQVVEALAAPALDPDGNTTVTKVLGMESRGFILGAPAALHLGVGFVPVRKAGKLPRETHAVSYSLEYGEATLEIHTDAVEPGERVLIIDDVLATGGTAAATIELVERCGGIVEGVSVLLELGFLDPRSKLPDTAVHALLST